MATTRPRKGRYRTAVAPSDTAASTATATIHPMRKRPGSRRISALARPTANYPSIAQAPQAPRKRGHHANQARMALARITFATVAILDRGAGQGHVRGGAGDEACGGDQRQIPSTA